jgi:rhodanese-related sulfurtransferase
MDNVVGFLSGGMTAWANAGLDADSLESISVPELRRRLDAGTVRVIDTRLYSEFAAGHIDGSVHVAAPDVRSEHPALQPESSLAVICNTGNRSVLAASLLRLRGFRDVVNVIGGTTAWQAAFYPLTAPAAGVSAHD